MHYFIYVDGVDFDKGFNTVKHENFKLYEIYRRKYSFFFKFDEIDVNVNWQNNV